jgi:hypothetical protein
VTRRAALLQGRGGVAVRGYPVTSAQSEEAWRASVEVLDLALREETTATSVRIVVSDHFLRYALVPWNESLVADSERLAFARLALNEIYGSMAEGWTVTLDQQPAGQPSFVCAMDRDLLQALRGLTDGRGLRLRAVNAALAERIDRHRSALRDQVFCLASLEPARLTLAFRNEAGWLAVRTRRVNGNPLEALSSVLRQEAAAAGAADGGTLYMIVDAATPRSSFSLPSWKVTRLDDGVAGAAAPARALDRMAAAE